MGLALSLVVIVVLLVVGLFGFLLGVIYLSDLVERWFKTQWARIARRPGDTRTRD